MSESVRVIVQLKSTPALAATSFGAFASPAVRLAAVPGLQFDSTFPPVPIPAERSHERATFALDAKPAAASYVMRAAVPAPRMDDVLEQAKADPNVVGVFADPRIHPIAAVCPAGPVGTDQDVAELLNVADLHAKGMDGTGVRVVIVDTGVNLPYLTQRGKHPNFGTALSWGPLGNQPLGQMPVGHGTMCAYDVCIAAPNCTLIDHALLTSVAEGGSAMDGFLSDALQSFGLLLTYLLQAPGPFAGDATPRTLVVNNSWGMFHPSWDFPVGSPQNYSDNPEHPFNIIVESLEEAGADILFAAGNCGAECPDRRCQNLTDAGIFGANSHASVLSIAGVKIDKQRIGYSTQGPGRLEDRKPDIASYTHFAGSGVYPADGGTSAATPVAAGIVAAVRRLYPASVVSPARLRDLIRDSAERRGSAFNYDYGHGILNSGALVTALEREFGPVTGSAARTARSRKSTRGSKKTGKTKSVQSAARRKSSSSK